MPCYYAIPLAFTPVLKAGLRELSKVGSFPIQYFQIDAAVAFDSCYLDEVI